MASAISFALYTVLGRRAFGKGSALAVVTGSTQYGLLFLLPSTIFELTSAEIGAITMQDGLLLYLGAGCSALAFLLCGYGLSHLEAGHGAVFGNLKPLVGVALAVVVLSEPLSGSQIGGDLLVLVGVGIAGGRWFPHPLTHQRRPRMLRVHSGCPMYRRAVRSADPHPSRLVCHRPDS